MIMLRESAGLLVFVTLLTTYASHTSGTKGGSLSANKRFLLNGYAVPSNISLEQFASCYLTCTPTYGKLLGTCCKSGLSVVCSNLPWDILKPKLGSCPGLLKSPTTSAWMSLEQFAACFLTCVVGFEKLAEACCQTGLDAICTNLPWELLTSQLGSCRSELSIITTTKPSTLPQPYWSTWGSWTCQHQGSVCFQTQERKCSTGVDKDCKFQPGEMATIVRLCSESTCPDFFSTKITRTTATTTRAKLVTSAATRTTVPPLAVQINGPDKDHFLKETQIACVSNPVAFTYTWKFNGTFSLPRGVTKQLISGHTSGGSGIDILHIKKLTESTFGTYTCAATLNGYTAEQSHFIGILAEKPTVNIIKPPVSSSFAMQCQVTGYPAPHIQWDFVPEANINRGLPHDVEVMYETYQSTLFVNKYVPVDHTGHWYCKASNAAGTAVKEVHIP